MYVGACVGTYLWWFGGRPHHQRKSYKRVTAVEWLIQLERAYIDIIK